MGRPHLPPDSLQAAVERLAALGADRLARLAAGGAPLIATELTPDGTILWSEGRAREALAVRRGETRGRRVQDAYADVPEVVRAAERALAGETVTAFLRVDGLAFVSTFMPFATGGRHRDGRPAFGVLITSFEADAVAAAILAADSAPASDAAPPAPPDTPEGAGLSPRQATVARGLSRGLSYSALADRLYIDESTIATHVGKICERMELPDLGMLRVTGASRGWGALPDADLDVPPPPPRPGTLG